MWILCPASAWLSGLLWLFSREDLPDLGWSPVTIMASFAVGLLPVLDRAAELGSTVLRTDLHGGLQMRWQDDQWRVSQAQTLTRRFWHVARLPAS